MASMNMQDYWGLPQFVHDKRKLAIFRRTTELGRLCTPPLHSSLENTRILYLQETALHDVCHVAMMPEEHRGAFIEIFKADPSHMWRNLGWYMIQKLGPAGSDANEIEAVAVEVAVLKRDCLLDAFMATFDDPQRVYPKDTYPLPDTMWATREMVLLDTANRNRLAHEAYQRLRVADLDRVVDLLRLFCELGNCKVAPSYDGH